jgi:crotonobetainyl-CoA:carnitine CoA-transferase CaiB-like acyl-CoA transferase
MEGRSKNCTEIITIIDQKFASKPREEWLKILKQSGDLIFAPVYEISDVCKDPQALVNDYITDFTLPDSSKTKVVGIPLTLSKTPGSIRCLAPEFGQHTEEILLDLGYSWEDIGQFKDKQVI